jgi:hypothetical protein
MYSQSQGEFEHRRCKRFYKRVNKGQYTKGIAAQQHRERVLRRLVENAPKSEAKRREYHRRCVNVDGDEILGPVSDHEHHQMSMDTRTRVELTKWLSEHRDDPAIKVTTLYFLSKINHF